MARLNMNRFAVVGVVAFAMSGALFSAACSSDSNPSPDNGPDASMGTGGKNNGTGGKSNSTGGKSNGGSTSTKPDSGTAGTGNTGNKGDGGPSSGGGSNGGDGGPGTGGSSGDSGTPPSGACPPDSKDFYSDKCTDSKCTPFDNSKLEKFKDGKLPALP